MLQNSKREFKCALEKFKLTSVIEIQILKQIGILSFPGVVYYIQPHTYFHIYKYTAEIILLSILFDTVMDQFGRRCPIGIFNRTRSQQNIFIDRQSYNDNYRRLLCGRLFLIGDLQHNNVQFRVGLGRANSVSDTRCSRTILRMQCCATMIIGGRGVCCCERKGCGTKTGKVCAHQARGRVMRINQVCRVDAAITAESVGPSLTCKYLVCRSVATIYVSYMVMVLNDNILALKTKMFILGQVSSF